MEMSLYEKMRSYANDAKQVIKTLGVKREFDRNQKLPADKIEQIQKLKFRRLLKHAVANSEFYREYYKGINTDTCDITDLPTLTKRRMMDNYDRLVTDKRLNRKDLTEYLKIPENASINYKNDFVILNSSGTTGEKAIMGYLWEEFRNVFAVAMSRGSNDAANPLTLLKSIVYKPLKIANIMLINSHSASFVVTFRVCTVEDHPLMKNRFFSIFTPIDKLVEQLNEFQPHVIQIYPSSLNYLAYEQLDGRLKLKFDDPRCSIISISEPLSDKTRKMVRKAFGIDVTNTYGACESIIMARECELHSGMHINSDLVIFEPVDENYKPVAPGKSSHKVLVTNLYTYAQPMIRYEVNDRVIMEQNDCTCENRLPKIKAVEGRTEEILFISKPGGGYEPVHPYIFLVPALNMQGFKEYQIDQVERDKAVFRIVPEKPGTITPEDLVKIMEFNMEREGLAGRMTFEGEVLDMIPKDPVSGKVIQIKSSIGRPKELVDKF
jgi:phenylacetate-CoA ligase